MLLLVGLIVPLALCRPPARLPAPLEESAAGRAIRAGLPDGLAPLRRAFVEDGAALLGRVGYFWGGKSDCLGWDPRWGAPAAVTAGGSSTTGRILPFGLDCSGFVSWCAVNAAGDPAAFSAIGDGVRNQWSRCTGVAWADALPGDLAFFPDLSHVGIVAGRGENGALLVLHCSSSLGGVVCSPDGAAAGFSAIGRPQFYDVYKNTPDFPRPNRLS